MTPPGIYPLAVNKHYYYYYYYYVSSRTVVQKLRHEGQLEGRTLLLLQDVNCDSKQTGLLPQRQTAEQTPFLQQSKQLRVGLQSCILCSGGHSLRYIQHFTGANIRTCSGYLQQAVCPPSQLDISMSRA